MQVVFRRTATASLTGLTKQIGAKQRAASKVSDAVPPHRDASVNHSGNKIHGAAAVIFTVPKTA